MQVSRLFREKTRVLRRSEVIDSCLLDKLDLARGQVPILLNIEFPARRLLPSDRIFLFSETSDIVGYGCMFDGYFLSTAEFVGETESYKLSN